MSLPGPLWHPFKSNQNNFFNHNFYLLIISSPPISALLCRNITIFIRVSILCSKITIISQIPRGTVFHSSLRTIINNNGTKKKNIWSCN